MCPVQEKGVCSDSNRTAQRLQMAARQSLEMMSGMILIRQQPKFAAKPCSDQRRQDRDSRTTILHAKKQFQVARNDYSCTVFSMTQW